MWNNGNVDREVYFFLHTLICVGEACRDSGNDMSHRILGVSTKVFVYCCLVNTVGGRGKGKCRFVCSVRLVRQSGRVPRMPYTPPTQLAGGRSHTVGPPASDLMASSTEGLTSPWTEVGPASDLGHWRMDVPMDCTGSSPPHQQRSRLNFSPRGWPVVMGSDLCILQHMPYASRAVPSCRLTRAPNSLPHRTALP